MFLQTLSKSLAGFVIAGIKTEKGYELQEGLILDKMPEEISFDDTRYTLESVEITNKETGFFNATYA